MATITGKRNIEGIIVFDNGLVRVPNNNKYNPSSSSGSIIMVTQFKDVDKRQYLFLWGNGVQETDNIAFTAWIGGVSTSEGYNQNYGNSRTVFINWVNKLILFQELPNFIQHGDLFTVSFSINRSTGFAEILFNLQKTGNVTIAERVGFDSSVLNTGEGGKLIGVIDDLIIGNILFEIETPLGLNYHIQEDSGQILLDSLPNSLNGNFQFNSNILDNTGFVYHIQEDSGSSMLDGGNQSNNGNFQSNSPLPPVPTGFVYHIQEDSGSSMLDGGNQSNNGNFQSA